MTTYSKGDRVRVTLEGEVVGEGNVAFRLLTKPGALASSSAHVRVNEAGVTIEKLAAPEPEWVHGDFVATFDGLTPDGYHYVRRHFTEAYGGQHWVDLYDNKVDDEAITKHWETGTLKILHKQDSPGVAAIACTPNQDR